MRNIYLLIILLTGEVIFPVCKKNPDSKPESLNIYMATPVQRYLD
jgi:hypothetical protein